MFLKYLYLSFPNKEIIKTFFLQNLWLCSNLFSSDKMGFYIYKSFFLKNVNYWFIKIFHFSQHLIEVFFFNNQNFSFCSWSFFSFKLSHNFYFYFFLLENYKLFTIVFIKYWIYSALNSWDITFLSSTFSIDFFNWIIKTFIWKSLHFSYNLCFQRAWVTARQWGGVPRTPLSTWRTASPTCCCSLSPWSVTGGRSSSSSCSGAAGKYTIIINTYNNKEEHKHVPRSGDLPFR